MSHLDAQCGNAPGVPHLRIDVAVIIEARQGFAESAQIDAVRSRQHGFLVARAETLRAKVEARTGAALESVPANKARMPRSVRYIAKANHIDAIGAMRRARRTGRGIEAGQIARRAAAHRVIHQVMAQHAARIGQAGGISARGRVQQDARRFQGLRAQNHAPGARLVGLV